ncbi:MAG: alanine dehydrogenase [Myxococcales bacterium]|nr:alanine dehydrogenase [Myxococcales bacterium]
MRIGVPKEIKDRENRVALTPDGAQQLAAGGHEVVVQHGAGTGSGFADDAYAAAGAKLGSTAEAWDSELVLKIKEPLEPEYEHLGRQILFTYLHLAGVAPALTDALLAAGTTAIAYETVEDEAGRLNLLAPMSAVAGAMTATVGNRYLAAHEGGKGTFLGRLLGRRSGSVLVIGTGTVGRHAAHAAAGLGARVRIAGLREDRIEEIQAEIGPDPEFILSTPENIALATRDADLVVGAVLLRGAKAPHVVTEAMVRAMQPGSVIVDVSIDQGGCVETARPTSHSDPVYTEHGVVHYCVTNMPGAYPRTSTIALTTATLPYATRLAERGLDALRDDPGFRKGLNVHDGAINCRAVAEALGKRDTYREFEV